jgi:ribosome-associated toxin RatA of RatAB toxin-antitoxin module
VLFPSQYGTIVTSPLLPYPSYSETDGRWESLQVTVIHNMFSDLEGKVRFDKETNASYIDMELDHHYFSNKK